METQSAVAGEPASTPQSANSTQIAEKSGAEQLPIKPDVAAPATIEKRTDIAAGSPQVGRVVPQAPPSVSAQVDKDVPIVDVQPMVPVSDGQPNGTESPANQSRVQRLPAVEGG